MPTATQWVTNRKNAARSPGPRREVGNDTRSRDALSHRQKTLASAATKKLSDAAISAEEGWKRNGVRGTGTSASPFRQRYPPVATAERCQVSFTQQIHLETKITGVTSDSHGDKNE